MPLGVASSSPRVGTWLGAALLVWSGALWEPSSAQSVLRIATVSGQVDAASVESFRAFTDHLSSRIPGTRFEMVPLANIEALLRAVDTRQVEFAFATPIALVTLNAAHRVRPVATVTQMAGDEAYPWLAGAVFVRADRADIRTLDDARGKRVVGLSQLALGGWLAAVREWRRLGIDERTDFDRPRFVFSYTRLAAEVCAGTADVGVLSAATLREVAGACPAGFRVLPNPRGGNDRRYPTDVSTPLYPETGFVVVGAVDERIVTAVTQELLSIARGSDVAKAAIVAGFAAPLSYTPVQELMEELRVGPYESFGRLSFAQAVQQHAGKVTATLVGFLSLLSVAFVQSRRLNRRLKASEVFRRRVFEGSLLPIVVMDADTLEFVDCNHAAVRIYGFASREETLGRRPIDVSAPTQYDGSESAAMVRVHVERALSQGITAFEWRHQRTDGALWDAEVHLMSFESDGRRLLQFTLLDVTGKKRAEEERAHLEEQLQQSQRMDSIGRLAGAVAHDFNNLLTVINGCSGVVLEDPHADQITRRRVTQIHRAGERAAQLTQQLLTFSRRQISHREALDVNQVVRDSRSMFQRLLGEDIEFVTSLRNGVGLILADPGQMHQVLMNLVVNARDAMPTGGTLTIATADVQLPAGAEGDAPQLPAGPYVCLRVADTGVGMDADTQRRIFEPFFTTKGKVGTGLGLSTVYGIVTQSQGGISVDSRPGQGTTFRVYLPHTSSLPEPVRIRRRVTAPVRRARTILVVEDEHEVRDFAVEVLRAAGYEVLEAPSGEAALRRAEGQQSIDLLLTDVVLSGINGRALSERFATLHPEARVLFTSGYTDDEIARRGVVQGSIEFLPKPYSPEALRARVADILDTLS